MTQVMFGVPTKVKTRDAAIIMLRLFLTLDMLPNMVICRKS